MAAQELRAGERDVVERGLYLTKRAIARAPAAAARGSKLGGGKNGVSPT